MKSFDDLLFNHENSMLDKILHRELQDVPKEKSTSNTMGEDDEDQFGLMSQLDIVFEQVGNI